jgi:hypothetical protein
MKTNLLKSISVIASLCMLAACSGPKNDNKGNITPTVGPSGRVQALGTENTYCDFSNGQVSCSNRDQNTQQVCTISKSYNAQDLNNFCSQMRAIYDEAGQPSACQVQTVVSRILSEHCPNNGMQPPNTNPNFPGQPGFPSQPGNPNFPPGLGSGRFISCNVISNGSFPALLSVPAFGGPGFAFVTLNERRGTKNLKDIVLGAVGISRKIGEVKVTYRPAQGKIPETLTATMEYKDSVAGRTVKVKHSGSASAPLSLDASINGSQITLECNNLVNNKIALPESANLVCVGSSHMVSQQYEENIQFIRPINSFLSGEPVQVSEAVSVMVDKVSGMLTVNTNIDSLLGPNMTSSSSLRADALIEASEGLGKAKFTCSVK